MKPDEHALEILKEVDWYNRWILTFIKNYLSGEILDVGAGIGNFSTLLRKYGKVTAIDQNEKYIKILKKQVKAGFGDIEKAKYFFGKKKFSTIISFNVFEHIRNDSKAFTNVRKLLADNGYFILIVPAHKYLYSNFDKKIGHYRRYTTSELASKINNSGLKVITIRYFNWWAAIGWFIFMRYLKRSRLPRGPVSLFNFLGRIFLWPEKILPAPFGLSVLAVAKKN